MILKFLFFYCLTVDRPQVGEKLRRRRLQLKVVPLDDGHSSARRYARTNCIPRSALVHGRVFVLEAADA